MLYVADVDFIFGFFMYTQFQLFRLFLLFASSSSSLIPSLHLSFFFFCLSACWYDIKMNNKMNSVHEKKFQLFGTINESDLSLSLFVSRFPHIISLSYSHSEAWWRKKVNNIKTLIIWERNFYVITLGAFHVTLSLTLSLLLIATLHWL